MSQSNPHIIIAGAGLAVAHRLRNALPTAKLTIIDGKTVHHYQPGYTLLASGVWKQTKQVTYRNADYIPKGVEWLKSSVAEFNPENNQLRTEQGDVLHYDYLVVATAVVSLIGGVAAFFVLPKLLQSSHKEVYLSYGLVISYHQLHWRNSLFIYCYLAASNLPLLIFLP